MVEKINATEPSSLIGEGEDNTPEYVTKTEINAMLNGFRASFKKDFSKLESALQTLNVPKDEEPAAHKGKPDSEKAEMQKQIKLLLDREKERETELLSQKLNATSREHLLAAGTNPAFVEHALAYASQKQLIKYDDEGNVKMRVNGVDYDISDGAKLWAKTDEAKLYMSPKNAVGSGHKGPVNQRPAPADTSKKAEDQFTELLKQLPAAMNGI